MDVRDRLKAWRHTLGLTQEEFARRIGIPKSTLVGYEVGQRKPGSDALAAIASTGCNMTWLLTGSGDMLQNKHVESATYESRYARRWEKIVALVEGIEDEAKRTAVLEEIFLRAQEVAELDALRKAVVALQKKTA